MEADAGGPIADLLAAARPEQAAIRSRWQHDAVPPWRRVEPTIVCEVRVTNLDLLVAGVLEIALNSNARMSLPDVKSSLSLMADGHAQSAVGRPRLAPRDVR